MRIVLEYRSVENPRFRVSQAVELAFRLIGLALAASGPLGFSIIGLYWDSLPVVALAACGSGACIVCAMLLAAAAVEKLCDLRGEG